MTDRFFRSVERLLVVGIVIVATYWGVSGYLRRANALTSEQFIAQLVPAALGGWHGEQILSHATAKLREKLPPEALDRQFARYHTEYGTFAGYRYDQRTSGDCRNQDYPQNQAAFYDVTAQFSAGAVLFRVWLILQDHQWQIDQFDVQPAPGSAGVKHT